MRTFCFSLSHVHVKSSWCRSHSIFVFLFFPFIVLRELFKCKPITLVLSDRFDHVSPFSCFLPLRKCAGLVAVLFYRIQVFVHYRCCGRPCFGGTVV